MHQIHAAAAPSEPAPVHTGAPSPRTLDVNELTILTGWAQAVAETLAYSPERLPELLAQAAVGAPWRAALNLEQPTPQLSEALETISHIVCAHQPPSDPVTLEMLAAQTGDDQPGEPALAALVRRVLRSTVEQRLSRLVREAD